MPLTATETAAVFGRLAWLNRRLFELVGAAAPRPEAALATVPLARHLGEHAQRWESLIPESILLEPHVGHGPPQGAEDLVGALTNDENVADTVFGTVVPWLLDTYRELDTRLTDHADGAARRLVRDALGDLAAATTRVG